MLPSVLRTSLALLAPLSLICAGELLADVERATGGGLEWETTGWSPWFGAAHLGQPEPVHGSGRRRLLNGFVIPNVKHILPPKQLLADNQQSYANGTGEGHTAFTFRDPARESRRRCALARGTWCGRYIRQSKVPYKPLVRAAVECPNACSGWGNCNYDTGLCDCPAGRGGPDCGKEVKRPCTNRYRHHYETDKPPVGHIGPDKHDLNVKEDGWLASRCYGFCDDDIALCFCGLDSRYRRIPPPPGSPPWTPPVQQGRAMTEGCMIGVDKDGSRITWGRPDIKFEDIYGPEGWCNKQAPIHNCGCVLDGIGHPCDGSLRHEPFCLNQCSGHGECYLGFCRCHPGWHGVDCSRKRAGMELEPGYLDAGPQQRRWLTAAVSLPPASLPNPPAPTRPRPLIYVYDMPPEYTTHMLQYRLGADTCMFRRFDDSNNTFTLSMTYSVEVYLHELMLQSEHRTFDPEEADFFYVPMYITCYMWPVLGWADHPWWYAPFAHTRPMHVANMILEAHQWLQRFPWWNRRGGRDHIWLMAHDEGACYMPTAVYNASIILTHWGRTDPHHTSGTAYVQDNYDNPLIQKPIQQYAGYKGIDWRDKTRGHPCYTPDKDLVIPAFKAPHHFAESPLLGAQPLVRDILLYFRGDIGSARQPVYSRGIRQKLFHLAHDNKWATKYGIYIGTGSTIEGSYSEHLARSKFCLVAPGDGWSPRAEDAVLHGCIPLVIMDGVHAVFESILNWDSFSVRIRESALDAVPQILQSIPPERVARMQRNLAKVWHRFAWATGPTLRRDVVRVIGDNRRGRAGLGLFDERTSDAVARVTQGYNFADDAWGTLMQWLYSRIEDTR